MKLVLVPLAFVIVSCTMQPQEPSSQVSPLMACGDAPTVQLIRLKATPWWNFWDKPSKSFSVCIDGKMKFIPLGAEAGDMLNEVSGPLGTVASHLSLAAP